MNIKVGDIVKGNKESNKYAVTSEERGFVGEVTSVWANSVWVKIVRHKSEQVIGKEYEIDKDTIVVCNDEKPMLVPKISIKEIIDSLMFAEKSLVKRYEGHEETLIKKILYEFRDEFLRIVGYHIDDRDSTKLAKEILEYQRNKEGKQ